LLHVEAAVTDPGGQPPAVTIASPSPGPRIGETRVGQGARGGSLHLLLAWPILSASRQQLEDAPFEICASLFVSRVLAHTPARPRAIARISRTRPTIAKHNDRARQTKRQSNAVEPTTTRKECARAFCWRLRAKRAGRDVVGTTGLRGDAFAAARAILGKDVA
jgi:hypothetical protein